MKFFALVLSLTFSMSVFATCMSECVELDAGMDPAYGSAAKVTTKCSPPGGPVNTSVEYFHESCKNGVLNEYVCENGQAVAVKIPCSVCSKERKGVCYEAKPVGPSRAPSTSTR